MKEQEQNEPESGFRGDYETSGEACAQADPGWYVCEAPGGGWSLFPPGTPPHSIRHGQVAKWKGDLQGATVPDFDEGFEIDSTCCDLRVIEYSNEHLHLLDAGSKTQQCVMSRNWSRCTADRIDFARYPDAGDEVAIDPGEKAGTGYYDGNEWRWLTGSYELLGDGSLEAEFISQSEIADALSEYRRIGIENFCCQFQGE